MQKLFRMLSTRKGFFWCLVLLFWAKTLLAYIVDFGSLGVATPFQAFIMAINPFATTILLLGIAWFFRSAKFFYAWLGLAYTLNTVLLYLNVIYFREFTDFVTINVILGYNKVNQGLGGAGYELTAFHDMFFWLDFIVIIGLMLLRKIKFDKQRPNRWGGLAAVTGASVLVLFNIALADMSRPQLLTRQFDRTYMVKYLGLDAFTTYDAINSHKTAELRKNAKSSEITGVLKYVHSHYVPGNPKFYGIAKGRNVIVIHLESFQQFVINRKIDGKEITPFLNSLYNSKSSLSFSNFFNQVGQGKTSDAENMLETSTFGLPQGSLFAQLGSDETFQAAPDILKQQGDYTSAVFHGNNAAFWNRNNTYKNMGYNYFYDASYYDTTGDRATGYGLKDKLLFHDSIQYLEHLQQPFYAKYITVTNHFPYSLDSEDVDKGFKTTTTDSKLVNNYFVTNRYLDDSVREFFDYLKKSGLYDNSVVLLYGDHYGISDSENPSLAPVLDKNATNWNDNDNAELQRVPLIIHIPGLTDGGVQDQYGGEIDVLPTLEHLLGIDNREYVQFGQDLMSPQHSQVVAFRNGGFVSPWYNYINGTVYDTKTGDVLAQTPDLMKTINAWNAKVKEGLSLSDSLNEKNLLRFYQPAGLPKVNPDNYNYVYPNGIKEADKIENNLHLKSTSIFSQNHDQSTVDLYQTNAPELNHKDMSGSRIQQTRRTDTNDGGSSSSSNDSASSSSSNDGNSN
ncbi:LTA synthase family protein [Periweissella fabaria]|uniref:Lipoteichoic acid synthase 1 n=1 Tax=Periweissella fabaria TaxID=546157 RepID=A0ABM8Z5S9_9LACO|nr:LTA synthase family protein [Periweissella fabaria]MCM0597565.1 LTA synthase family protein [Periweissella fabaria]CAH0416750.1 Lipoteichoic acid synthase 1 [Periweissella fabaria]